MQDYFHPQMTQQELLAMSSLALAHIGDAVFELLVRTKLCVEGGTTNGRLHQQTVALVQAPAQARFAARIQPLLTPEEAAVYRRGRNAHPHGIPKHATPGEYARATGLEALFGALYLSGKIRRVLVVAPLSILGVWDEEFAKFADFDYSLGVLNGSGAKKAKALRRMTGSQLQVAVVNYESAWRLEKEIAAWKPDLVIADEGHKIKTHNISCLLYTSDAADD